MKLINTEEIIENDSTYIVETYDNGTVNKYIKPQETTGELPSQPEPITNEDILNAMQASRVQRGHIDCAGTTTTIALDPVDVSRATVSLSGPVRSYTLTEDQLTVEITEPGYINWEVRG